MSKIKNYQVLVQAVRTIITKMTPMLLTNRMTVKVFRQLSLDVMVKVAKEDCLTNTAVARKTGLSRRTVAKVLGQNHSIDNYASVGILSKIMQAWERRYGVTHAFPLQTSIDSWSDFCKELYPDQSPNNILRDLLACNCVKICDDQVQFKSKFVFPEQGDVVNQLGYYGSATGHLLEAMFHNMYNKQEEPLLQREAWSDDVAIDEDLALTICKQIKHDMEMYMRQVEDMLSDAETKSSCTGKKKVTIGFGSYLFKNNDS